VEFFGLFWIFCNFQELFYVLIFLHHSITKRNEKQICKCDAWFFWILSGHNFESVALLDVLFIFLLFFFIFFLFYFCVKNFKKKKRCSKMPVFNFPQFEHEPCWSYLSTLNDYRAQLNQSFEKWKICEVIVVGLNALSRGYVESMCLEGFQGLLSKTKNEVWNFFEKVAWFFISLNKSVMVGMRLILTTETTLYIYITTYLTLLCLLFCVIIASLLIIMFIIIFIVIMLMLHVWVLKNQ